MQRDETETRQRTSSERDTTYVQRADCTFSDTIARYSCVEHALDRTTCQTYESKGTAVVSTLDKQRVDLRFEEYIDIGTRRTTKVSCSPIFELCQHASCVRRNDCNDRARTLHERDWQPTCTSTDKQHVVHSIRRSTQFKHSSLSNCRTPDGRPNSCCTSQLSSLNTLEQYRSGQDSHRVLLSSVVSTSLRASTDELVSHPTRHSPACQRDESSQMTHKSCPSTESLFQSTSDRQIIDVVPMTQTQMRSINVRVDPLAASTSTTKTKKPLARVTKQTKSIERQEQQPRLSSKRTCQRSIHPVGQITIQTATSTTMPLKRANELASCENKWDAPYVNMRVDPPTPACSLSLPIQMENADDDPFDRASNSQRTVASHDP
jgi:hypothetical protein